MSVAMLSRQSGTMTALRRPRVWVDGARREDIAVQRLTMIGPADRRDATLRLDRAAGGPTTAERAAHHRLLGRRIVIDQPIDLGCGEAVGYTLLRGRIVGVETAMDARTDRLTLRAIDDWTGELDRTVDMNGAGTVGEAIDRLGEALGATRVAVTTDAATLRRPIRPSAATLTIARLIDRLGDEHAVVVRQRPTRRDWSIELRDARQGRPLVIDHGEGAAGSALTRRATETPYARPMKFIGRLAGETVERTIELQPGWAAADEASADADYSPATSTDWPRFANVYRRWTAAAHAGPLGDCLTTDPEGHRLPAIISFTTDDGATWRAWPGAAAASRDAVGVRLTDAELPADYFAAARAGAVRLRVTGTVRSPEPIELVRWAGNPFAGPFETRLIDVGESLALRRVDPSSRFAAAVAAGDRAADVRDDRPVLARMLVDAATDRRRSIAAVVTCDASPPRVGLRLGDRLASAGDRPGAEPTMRRIEHRWGDRPVTRATATHSGG